MICNNINTSHSSTHCCSKAFLQLFCTLLLILAAISPVVAGDLAKGEKTYIKCKICHTVEKDVSKIGPSLYGVYGRKSGTLASFLNYSDAMKAADIVWSDETIREFLKAPRTYVANTKMLFMGIRNDEEIDDLLAYLRSVTGAEASANDSETSDVNTITEDKAVGTVSSEVSSGATGAD